MGEIVATGTVGAAMANAGAATLFSSAVSSFGRTGDPIATAKEVFSPQNLKALGISMASAGICSELGSALKIETNPGLKAAMDSKYQPGVLDFAKANVLNTAVTVPLNVAIGGENPGDAILHGLKTGAINTIGQYAAYQIGNAYRDAPKPSDNSTVTPQPSESKVSEGNPLENPSSPKIGYTAHKVIHGIMGSVTGWGLNPTTKGLISGAIGAFTTEVAGEALLSDAHEIADAVVETLKEKGTPLTKENVDKAINREIRHRGDIARLTASGVAALTGQDASTAFTTGTNAVENNCLPGAVVLAYEAYPLVCAALGVGSAMTAVNMAKDKLSKKQGQNAAQMDAAPTDLPRDEGFDTEEGKPTVHSTPLHEGQVTQEGFTPESSKPTVISTPIPDDLPRGIVVESSKSEEKSRNTKTEWSVKNCDKIAEHNSFGKFYRDPNTRHWCSKDLGEHGGSSWKVFEENSKGLEWIQNADKYGEYIPTNKEPIGKSIPWKKLSIKK